MRLIRIMKSTICILSAVLFIFAVAMIVYPVWQRVGYVKEYVPQNRNDNQTETIALNLPENVHLTVIFSLAEGDQELSQIMIEIMNLNANTVFYLDIPVDSKITLSKNLYQRLLVYAPGLPQYLKLSKMPAEFSEDYRMDGCIQILQEVLGVTVSDWICTEEKTMKQWRDSVAQKTEEEADTFWTQYTNWITNTTSNQSKQERLIYYEAFLHATAGWEGTIPGTQEVDGFMIQKTHTKEKIDSLMLKTLVNDKKE